MDKIDRIMEITDRYLERFGRALIGIYYLPPLTVIDSILLSADNPEYGKSRLKQFLYSPGLNQTVTANWHQRTFGMSRLR